MGIVAFVAAHSQPVENLWESCARAVDARAPEKNFAGVCFRLPRDRRGVTTNFGFRSLDPVRETHKNALTRVTSRFHNPNHLKQSSGRLDCVAEDTLRSLSQPQAISTGAMAHGAPRPRHVADSWFWMLDGRVIDAGALRRTAVVTAIHMVGRDAWIQLECNVNANCSLVLRVTPETTLHDALRTIEAMISTQSEA